MKAKLSSVWSRFIFWRHRHKRLTAILACLFGVLIVLEVLSWSCVLVGGLTTRSLPSCTYLVGKYVPVNDRIYYLWGDEEFLPATEYQSVEEPKLYGRIYYLPRNELFYNGLACYPYAFIADDLPVLATRYVELHESYHLLGVNSETETNYLAAQKEPWGLVELVVESVRRGIFQGSVTALPCRVGRMWFVFKVYFLGFGEILRWFSRG